MSSLWRCCRYRADMDKMPRWTQDMKEQFHHPVGVRAHGNPLRGHEDKNLLLLQLSIVCESSLLLFCSPLSCKLLSKALLNGTFTVVVEHKTPFWIYIPHMEQSILVLFIVKDNTSVTVMTPYIIMLLSCNHSDSNQLAEIKVPWNIPTDLQHHYVRTEKNKKKTSVKPQ